VELSAQRSKPRGQPVLLYTTNALTVGAEYAGVENAGATKYGKTSEENTIKYQTKYGCRGFYAYLLAEI